MINEVEGLLNILESTILESTSRNFLISELDQVAFVISFILQDRTAPDDIVDRVEGALPQFDGDPSFGVLAFQPSGKTIL